MKASPVSAEDYLKNEMSKKDNKVNKLTDQIAQLF